MMGHLTDGTFNKSLILYAVEFIIKSHELHEKEHHEHLA